MLLPAPFGPTKPVTRPGETVKDRSSTATVAPKLMHEMVLAARTGDVVKARDTHFKLLGLHKNLFIEANPIPAKWAVQQLGLIGGGIRLPLTTLSSEYHDRVRGAMREAGIQI